MNFCEFPTIYDIYRRADLTSRDFEKFYVEHMRGALDECLRLSQQGMDERAPAIHHIQMATELDWMRANRPYYKIYPGLLPYFIDTKIDIPNEYLQLPFQAIVIRLPEDHNIPELQVNDHLKVRSILVGSKPKEELAVMFGGSHRGLFPDIVESVRQMFVWIDVGEGVTAGMLHTDTQRIETINLPILTYKQLLFQDQETTVETVVKKIHEAAEFEKGGFLDDGGVLIPIELPDACLRIAVAVAFLATGGDKIIEADVLNRDLLRYVNACNNNDEEAQQRILDRAKRNRKFGWTMGRELPLLSRSKSDSYGDSEGTGRELKHQHQRGAHFHYVRVGPGKAQVSLRFFRQTTVRPDLPVNPKAKRGYKGK